MMTPERWQKVKAVLQEALELAPEQRQAFLDRACSTDHSLRREVESLLSSSNEVRSSFMKSSANAGLRLSKGTRLGDFEILSLLGSGGMGEVYRARDCRLERGVAIKVLPRFLSFDPERLHRFEQEAKAAAALNHPNILAIFHMGTYEGAPYLVSELLEGETLREQVKHGPIPLKKALDYGVQIAHGLAAAHEKGIVHRDLKPENLFVTRDGRTKILDFGLAKLTHPQGGTQLTKETLYTEPGTVLGTVGYMSPEQVRGQAADHRSDIFAFGAILYEMLSGKRAFQGETNVDTMSAILNEDPPSISQFTPSIPPGVQRAVHRCLEKTPEQRFQSALDLAFALEVSSETGRASTGGEVSIAVLPFANMSADPENEFFADGITEEIINALTQIANLRVAARTSAFTFKNKQVDLRIVGERLGVKTVLEGSVRKSGNRVRIMAQLTGVADGCHLWSERYDRELKDIFEVQDDIARAIANRLRVALKSDQQATVKAGTSNLEAYQLYLKGRALLYHRGLDIPRSVKCFERAVALDPQYALAWSGLADARNMLGLNGLDRPEATIPQAKEAATQAVTLDPMLAEAHCSLACSYLLHDWKWSDAEGEFLRALELNPRYLQNLDWYALFYLGGIQKRFDEGIALAKRAVEYDPLSAYAHEILALVCGVAGRTSEAVRAAKSSTELEESFFAYWVLQCALHWDGHYEEAVAAGDMALALSGRSVYAMSAQATIFADGGKIAEAKAIYAELMARAAREYILPTHFAIAASAAGELDKAVTHGREAYEIRDPWLFLGRYWPDFGRLCGDPRFEEILARMEKAPEQRFQAASDPAFALEAPSDSDSAAIGRFASTNKTRTWKWITATVITVVIAGVAFAQWSLYHRKTGVLTEKDAILLGDFTNTTGDAVFDGTLREGLSVQLEQSPFLSLVPDEKIQHTLGMMKQPPDARLTHEIAKEICQRTGSTAVLDGSIAQIGTQYSLILKALNCANGESLASTEAQASDKSHVLEALGKASSEIRKNLGESLATVQKFDIPLEQATTPSLEALKSYTLGVSQRAKGDSVAALPLLQQAIRLDPNFAMAYATLSVIYDSDWGETTLSAQNIEKAYELRDRVSERERFYIESQYYEFARGDLEKARQTDTLWAQIYPRDARPWTLLSTIYNQLGQLEDALVGARQALRLDPDQLNYYNFVYSLLALNRLQEAQTTIKEEQARKIDSAYLHYSQSQFAFLEGDASALSEQVAWARGRPGYEHVLMAFAADADACAGHLSRARELTRQAVASAEREQEKEAAATYEAEAALREALIGNRVEAKRWVAEAESLSTGHDVQFGAALAKALGGDSVGAESLADNLAKRFPEDTIIQFNYLPTIRAQLALNRGDATPSTQVLRSTTPYELGTPTNGVILFALYPVYVRGSAFMVLHRGNEAAVEFQKILDHRGVVMNEPISALAHLQLGRAYVMSGDAASARAAYQDFLSLWKDADPDIPILKQAKAEYAKLQ